MLTIYKPSPATFIKLKGKTNWKTAALFALTTEKRARPQMANWDQRNMKEKQINQTHKILFPTLSQIKLCENNLQYRLPKQFLI